MKRISAIILLIFFTLALHGCGSSGSAPPRELWYLGGAPILEAFSTSGAAAKPSGDLTDIVIFVPFQLVQDGFSASILGTTKEGTQDNLLESKELTPGEYYVVSSDTYRKYESLSLHLTYSWDGQVMSMRVIDLYSHTDLVPAYP